MRIFTCTLALAAALFAASPIDPGAELYAAIRANDLVRLKSLLASGPVSNVHDSRGVTPLMHAAVVGSADAMRLLLDAGADVNAKNDVGSDALMWSATDLARVRLLLERGADVNAASERHRTALLVAAMSDGSAPIVRLLIAKGADVHAVDSVKISAMHAATLGGDADTVRLLIEAGADVDTPDAGGYTPLTNAAQNGNLRIVQMLLAKGANVDAVTEMGDMQSHVSKRVKNGPLGLGRFTPLLAASPYGPASVVDALVRAGADVNARDSRGLTPLMLAVASDHADVRTVETLIAARTDLKARSLDGETALDWALKSGHTPIVDLLKRAGAPATPASARTIPIPSPVELKPAFERSLSLVEKSSGQFFDKGGCVACHAQNITDVTVATARGRGLRVDGDETANRVKVTKDRFAPIANLLLEHANVGGTPDVPAYSLLGLAASGAPADWTTDAMVSYIASQQFADGRWHLGGIVRPPISDGCDIARTAVIVRALKVYGPPGRAAEMRARIDKARAWLLAAPTVTEEDRSMRLLGLAWSGAEPSVLRRSAAAILAGQRPDGGWGQRRELESDAYASGQALYALATAGGVTPGDAAYQKGVRFLLGSQRADGSWYVRSRAIKFQPFFESGFPYGHDQWISAMATGWATAALAAAVENRPAMQP